MLAALGALKGGESSWEDINIETEDTEKITCHYHVKNGR